jgi:outer membrane protein assembly factor BamB
MVMAAPAAGADGTVFVAQMDGAVSAFGPEGSRRFVYETGADYLTAGPVCDSEGTAFVGDCLGRLHVVRKDGAGRVVFEAARSIQARPSLDARRNLYLPAMDRCVYVFRNRAAV